MKFKRDAERDARLVYAAMNGVIVPLAIQIGWTTSDLDEHGKWLRKQSAKYMTEVTKIIMKLEDDKSRLL